MRLPTSRPTSGPCHGHWPPSKEKAKRLRRQACFFSWLKEENAKSRFSGVLFYLFLPCTSMASLVGFAGSREREKRVAFNKLKSDSLFLSKFARLAYLFSRFFLLIGR
uniref:Uncharacterized protein n=2 Tax=Anthoceros TaxID=3233 RepID=A0A6M8ATL1_ANTPU|nr:hypothetical protein [Anthoceros punctatus]YP_009863195.1 hypothetical protein [Anthoceros agrestis]QKD76609.1 hypothetical protein [Anthoceros punctatus]QKD76651.1 hypothetical protein [Anthoceros agrestis]